MLLYKSIGSNGIQLWHSAKPSDVHKIQTIQSNSLRQIIKAPFYVSITFFTNEGSEYAYPLAGRITTTFPSSSDNRDFAFLVDLARDGLIEVETGGVPV